ncbi:MAG: ATP phosphoribosyltransferase [Bacillota bacterium]
MPALTLALAKGRLLPPSLKALAKAGLGLPELEPESRQAVFHGPGGLRVIIIRDDDIPTYVARGAADLGIVGKDILEEAGGPTVELADLGYARCRLVLAVPQGQNRLGPDLTVATKYPRVSTAYFSSRGVAARVIHVHGATELAPRLGLAGAIVDLVATGRTLEVNQLEVADTILHASARLIGNPASCSLKGSYLWPLVERLKECAGGEES